MYSRLVSVSRQCILGQGKLVMVLVQLTYETRAIITSTGVSSVFRSSYGNMVLNQSACLFALGYFLINNKNTRNN